MELTNLILNKKKKSVLTLKEKIPALVASVFSILFALSIVKELANVVEGYVLVFLVVFMVLFLIFNERAKVNEIKKLFKGNRNALPVFAFTFLISVGLSGMGIYFWTNKTAKIKNDSSIAKQEEVTAIKSKYFNKIQDINSEKFESTEAYLSLAETLNFWKRKSAATLAERDLIRKRIEDVQNEINTKRNEFIQVQKASVNQLNDLQDQEIAAVSARFDKETSTMERNDLVSYIFLIMILITEIVILILNKEIASREIDFDTFMEKEIVKSYIDGRKLLTSLYLSKGSTGKVSIHDVQYNEAIKGKEWAEVKKLFNMFITLDIFDNAKKVKGLPTSKIKMEETEALKKYDAYFNQLMHLN